MVELVVERGYEGVTVRRLTKLARVSGRSFYRHFGSVDECFASACEWILEVALGRASAAASAGHDWESRLRLALSSLLDSCAKSPGEASLILLEPFEAGPDAQARVRKASAGIGRLLAECLSTSPREVVAPRHLLDAMVAAITRVTRTTTAARRASRLTLMAPELGDWMASLPRLDVIRLPGAARVPRVWPVPSARTSRRYVGSEWQRALRAAERLASRDGAASLTAGKIRAEAGISRRSFDAHFEDVTACLLSAIELSVVEAVRYADVWVTVGEWERRVCHLTSALCARAAAEPDLARLAFIELVSTGRTGLHCRERLISNGAIALRQSAPSSHFRTQLSAEASLAAVWRTVERELAAGRHRMLPAIAPALSYLLLAPTIGAADAVQTISREGRRPAAGGYAAHGRVPGR